MPKLNGDVTSGSIIRSVFSLSIPASLGLLMDFALNVVNIFWVGKLGPAAQDAVASTMVIIWPIMALSSLVITGLTALVARHVGARELPSAAYIIKQSLYFGLLIGVSTSLTGMLAVPAMLDFMQVSEATTQHAAQYLLVYLCGSWLFPVVDSMYASFRASGDTATPAKVGALVVLLNILLDPLLIFGWGPIPPLGITGAACATVLSLVIGTYIMGSLLIRGKLGYSIRPIFDVKPQLSTIRRIARIGLPITVQQLAFVMVYWFIIRTVHEFGVPAGAAMGIGNRMESFAYLTCAGFGIAAATMVGQNLGAGKPDRAARCAWGTVTLGIAVTSIISLCFLLLPTQIAGVFSNDPQVIHIAADYLRILGLSQFTMATEIILEGAFSGAGDTLPPLIVLLPGAIIRIPMAWYLAVDQGWGINGVWWTLTITTTIKASILAYWFSRNRWQRKIV